MQIDRKLPYNKKDINPASKRIIRHHFYIYGIGLWEELVSESNLRHEEFGDQYPEYAAANEPLKKKHKLKWLTGKLAAAAKMAILAAALAAGMILSMDLRIESVLDALGQTTATVDTQVIAQKRADRLRRIAYTLQRVRDGHILLRADLAGEKDSLQFDNLTPNTRYQIAYTTMDEQGMEEFVGRFQFVTLDEENKPGNGRGPRSGTGAGEQGDEPDEQLPAPIPMPMVNSLKITTSSLPIGYERTKYAQVIGAEYTGADGLRFSAAGLPSGLSMGTSGIITGTPALGTAGTYPVTVQATDGTIEDTRTYALSILATTEPLLIVTEDLPSTQLGFQYKSLIETNRASSKGLKFSASGLPSGLDIDPDTGDIFGKVAINTRVGTHNVLFSATDGILMTQKTIGIYVGWNNEDLKILSFIGGVDNTEDTFAYRIEANDAKDVKVSYSYVSSDETQVYASAAPPDRISDSFPFGSHDRIGDVVLHVRYTLGEKSMHKQAVVSMESFGRVDGFTYAMAGENGAYAVPTGSSGLPLCLMSIHIVRSLQECQGNYGGKVITSGQEIQVPLQGPTAATGTMYTVKFATLVFTNHVDGTKTYITDKLGFATP